MQPGRQFRWIFCGILCVLLGDGCASVRSALTSPSKQVYAVKTEWTDFYLYSPRQGNGPDKTLPKNTSMRIIRAAYAFSKVHLETGEEGFVANTDIAPSSSQLMATSTTEPLLAAPASEWHAEMPEPRPATGEPPLPEFEPTPIPPPSDPAN